MTGTITIKNWRKYQHYKHRNPPWVKLHRTLLKKDWYRGLTDLSARWLFELWLLASKDGGTIPYDSLMILREAGRPSSNKALLDIALQELASVDAIAVAGTDASADFFASFAPVLAPPQAHLQAHRGTEVQRTENTSNPLDYSGASPRVVRSRVVGGSQ